MSHRIAATLRSSATRVSRSRSSCLSAPAIFSSRLPSSNCRLCKDAPHSPTLRYGGARWIASTPPTFKDAEEAPKTDASTETPSDDATANDDECPEWQNPLHHNNPEKNRVMLDDFAPGEEVPMAQLPPFDDGSDPEKVIASPELHDISDRIVRLSMLEVKELTDRIGDHFGFSSDGFVDDDDDDDDEEGAEEVKVEEKTIFDVKLTGFDAKSKIKVIKEVRSVTALGLKEAKELVEGAPSTVKKDMKKEEAEELKAKLEALGATVEIV